MDKPFKTVKLTSRCAKRDPLGWHSLSAALAGGWQGAKKLPLLRQGPEIGLPLISQTLGLPGVGTWRLDHWLPGFTGPVPSTSLDKSWAYSIWQEDIKSYTAMSRIRSRVLRFWCWRP